MSEIRIEKGSKYYGLWLGDDCILQIPYQNGYASIFESIGFTSEKVAIVCANALRLVGEINDWDGGEWFRTEDKMENKIVLGQTQTKKLLRWLTTDQEEPEVGNTEGHPELPPRVLNLKIYSVRDGEETAFVIAESYGEAVRIWCKYAEMPEGTEPDVVSLIADSDETVHDSLRQKEGE